MAVSPPLPQIVSPSLPQPKSVSRSRTASAGLYLQTPSSPQPSSFANSAPRQTILHSYFDALFAAHGPQHWWPGRTRFEIVVGAILTQNTSWKNVERALRNLRKANLLSAQGIRKVPSATLAAHLRPSGYFRQKTKTLKAFVTFLYGDHRGSLSRLFATPTTALRQQLLALRGIGPETADSILLYAGKHPVFVVDAYSRRILERHALIHPKASYGDIRATFESALPHDHQLFNEFHALIVHTGKHFCRKTNPTCSQCPLQPFLPRAADRCTQITSRESPATSHSPLAPLATSSRTP